MTLQCDHPGCDATFEKEGKKKFCDEHSKHIYANRRCLAKKRLGRPEKLEDVIVDVLHYQEITRCCRACGKHYRTDADYHTPINSVYCELHRNEFKRELYLKSHDPYSGSQPPLPDQIGPVKAEFYKRLIPTVLKFNTFTVPEFKEAILKAAEFSPLDRFNNPHARSKIIGTHRDILDRLIVEGIVHRITNQKYRVLNIFKEKVDV